MSSSTFRTCLYEFFRLQIHVALARTCVRTANVNIMRMRAHVRVCAWLHNNIGVCLCGSRVRACVSLVAHETTVLVWFGRFQPTICFFYFFCYNFYFFHPPRLSMVTRRARKRFRSPHQPSSETLTVADVYAIWLCGAFRNIIKKKIISRARFRFRAIAKRSCWIYKNVCFFFHSKAQTQ